MIGTQSSATGRVGAIGARMARRDFQEATWGYILIAPWLIGLVLLTAGPMVASFYMAFTSYDLMHAPVWIGLSNYDHLLHDRLVWLSLKATAIYTFESVPLRVALALLVAVLLNQKVRGMPVFRTIFYLPTVVASVAVTMLWTWILSPEFGLLNTMLARIGIVGPSWLSDQHTAIHALVVMSLWSIGGNMVIFLAALQGVPQHLYEAADVEGANRRQKMWHITIPTITPSIFFVLVMSLIGSFQVFTAGYIMTGGGPNNTTLFYVLYLYRNALELLRMGYASALAWVLFVIIMAGTGLIIRSSAVWVYYEAELRK